MTRQAGTGMARRGVELRRLERIGQARRGRVVRGLAVIGKAGMDGRGRDFCGEACLDAARQAMSTRTTCSGLETVEFDDGDTEDLELVGVPLDTMADAWERLADAFADDIHCPACPWDERGFNIYSQKRWHECHCADPAQCIAINPKAVANAFRKQAS